MDRLAGGREIKFTKTATDKRKDSAMVTQPIRPTYFFAILLPARPLTIAPNSGSDGINQAALRYSQ